MKLNNSSLSKKFIIRRCIIAAAAIIICLAAVKIVISHNNKVYTNNENTEETASTDNNSIEENNEEESDLDNSGYLPLEKDENAEDAAVVSNLTDELIKGKIHYPVRNDGKKVVYLTFDDGPSTTNTPTVLDILKENNIKGTFFIMGKNAELNDESKEILRRTAKEGHAIANHTYTHDYNNFCPNRRIDPDKFMAEVEKCNDVLRSILGKDFKTRVIRCPGGSFSWKGKDNLMPIINEKGYVLTDWDSLCEDAEGKTKNADELIAVSQKNLDALGKDADSVIFLMHDTYYKGETAKALQGIIDLFKERGFEFKTLK